MHTDANHAPRLESAAALRGISAVLVAERQEREDRGAHRAEWILARAGLSTDQIAAIKGNDANRVRAIIENDNAVASPARRVARHARTNNRLATPTPETVAAVGNARRGRRLSGGLTSGRRSAC